LAWSPDRSQRPDAEIRLNHADAGGYFIDLGTNDGNGQHLDGVDGVTLENLTFNGGNRLHGAIVGNNADNLILRGNTFEHFTWSGVRTRLGDGHVYEHNRFDHAGGKIGTTGGMIFAARFTDGIIRHNTFVRDPNAGDVYGVKGRLFDDVRIRHNTFLGGSFSIELPFENDRAVTISHNVISGTVSIPKSGGGPVPEGGHTFDIHHNHFTKTYAIEGPRNGVRVHHNLFDFETADDGGNLVSQFGGKGRPADGPFAMSNNLIKNPGRGIFWSDVPQNEFVFRNNEVIVNPTATPRTAGLIGIRMRNDAGATDFATVQVVDNIVTIHGAPRDLMRNEAGRAAVIENNTLNNVADAATFENADADRPRGLQAPLRFTAGADGAWVIDGWEVSRQPPG
jgi:nitrous oxidase accessory protein